MDKHTPRHVGPKSAAYIMAESASRLIVLDGGTEKRVGRHHFEHADAVIKTQEAQHRFHASRLNPTATNSRESVAA